MFLGFGYLYRFAIFYVYLQKAENNRSKRPESQNFVMFFVLLTIGSLGLVDQQINLVSPNTLCLYHVFLQLIIFDNYNERITKHLFLIIKK